MYLLDLVGTYRYHNLPYRTTAPPAGVWLARLGLQNPHKKVNTCRSTYEPIQSTNKSQ